MWLRKLPTSTIIGLCACLVLSGCFQGYGENVSSQAEIDQLMLSLTPGNNAQSIASPVVESSPVPVENTRVPTLPPPTTTPDAIVMEGGIVIHIVASGETLFSIAQQYNVDVTTLQTMNGLADPNALFIEQALIIPPTIVPQPPTDEPTQTSNLPTEPPTALPTLTFTPTFTVTASPTATLTPSSTVIPSTATFTPSSTVVPPTGILTLTPSSTIIPPTATAVTLSTQTPSPSDSEDQLRATTATVHVIESGETLFQVSRIYNVSLESLTAANQISDPSQVVVGQELLIPEVVAVAQTDDVVLIIPSETPQPTVETDEISDAVHVVAAGETLYQISLDYGVSLDALAATNNITDTGQVTTGQTLQIPLATPMSVLDVSATIPQVPVSSTAPVRIALDFPKQINGVGLTQIFQVSPEAESHILRIYEQGQALGRNPRAFSKLGDSTIENPHFLARFDHWQGFDYNLGDYVYLEGVIEYYAGSFIRQGAAVRRGMHSWTVFDPQWADKSLCTANESALACEFRIQNPSILFIRLGANDVGVPQAFENNLRDVIDFSIENGVIPILGTKSDRNDGMSNANNQIIRRLSAEYELPLWDFDRLADTLPRRGLTTDGVHMTINFSHDYTDPNTFRTGHGTHNLSALVVLDSLWQILSADVG